MRPAARGAAARPAGAVTRPRPLPARADAARPPPPLPPPPTALVVVEGRSDAVAVRRATGRSAYSLDGATRAKNDASRAALAAAARAAAAAVLLFDPDAAGRAGRDDVARLLLAEAPGVALFHAFVPRSRCAARAPVGGKPAGDVGVEHAAADVVRHALAAARPHTPGRAEFSGDALRALGVAAPHDAGAANRSGARRAALAAHLGIGSVTGAQLLRTLNECGFTRGEVEAALAEVDAAGDAGAAPAA
jgi:5S rRNA maturation endonuclease (ribonuclease M5)